MAETIKEFFVQLNWDVEKNDHATRRFETSITLATAEATILAEVLVGIAKAIVAAAEKAAVHFDNLYFAAQRLNTTAALANDFPVLIKKYGGNSAEAASLLEQMAAKLRVNSSYITVINELGFGLDKTTGKLGIQKEMLGNLKNMTDQQIHVRAEILNIPEQPLLLMKRHLSEILPDLKAYEDYRKSLGVDIEDEAKNGLAFQTAWRDVEWRMGEIGQKINDGLQVAFTPLLTELDKFLTVNAKAIGDALTIVIDALTNMFVTWSKDFDTILSSPDSTKAFAESIHAIAEVIAWLAMMMEKLVVALRALSGISDFLNRISGRDNDWTWADAWKWLTKPDEALADSIVKGLNDRTGLNGPPAPNTLGGYANRGWNWLKERLSGGGGAGLAADPGGAAASGGAFVIGDSLGEGVKDALHAPGVTQVGAGTSVILQQIAGLTREQLANKTVILSGGASNSHDPGALIAQINLLKTKGVSAANIRVLGVGTRADFVGYNERLQKLAEASGATFVPIINPGEVHPSSYAATAAAAMAARRAVAAPAPPKPSPYGQLTPFTAPPVAPQAWTSHYTLGGAGGGSTLLNAPSKTTIRIDGTGDPTAVAHLVNKAQKGVNDDLGQTLQQATP